MNEKPEVSRGKVDAVDETILLALTGGRIMEIYISLVITITLVSQRIKITRALFYQKPVFIPP